MKIVVPSKNQLDNDRRRQTCIQSAGQEPPCSLPAFLWLCVSLLPSIGETLCQRTEYFLLDTTLFQKSGKWWRRHDHLLIRNSRRKQGFPAFSGSSIHGMLCVHIVLLNEQKHKWSWPQTTVFLCRGWSYGIPGTVICGWVRKPQV